MTRAEQLAAFVVEASYEKLSTAALQALKIHILDALGCAIGALGADLMGLIRTQMEDFGGAEDCTLIGGGKTAPDRAAFYNSALIRYLDFNDGYLAPGETCHPSDNIGSVLAAAEYADCSGKEFLTALAVAYQVQCRLSDLAPVRAHGFDHTVQGSFALAAGLSRALGLDQKQTANAIAICGTAFNALRVTRTGALSHWKGLAYPNTAFGCTHAAFLAMRGVTGPAEVFEGNKGFMDTISGRFEIDWSKEDLDRVTQTVVKRYNAEIHSQSAIEGILEMKEKHGFNAADVKHVEIDIFPVAYHIIGGGEEGGKTQVRNKEEADHSLPYLIAVALIDGEVMPRQHELKRIGQKDVQALLKHIHIRPSGEYGQRFPKEMPCRLQVALKNGDVFTGEKHDYEGFLTRPATWNDADKKFHELSKRAVDASLRKNIIDAIAHLENISVKDLTTLLSRVPLAKEPAGEAA